MLLKLVGRFVSLRMSEEDMEAGDVAVHGHEVYPSDIPSLALPTGIPGWVAVPLGSEASKSSEQRRWRSASNGVVRSAGGWRRVARRRRPRSRESRCPARDPLLLPRSFAGSPQSPHARRSGSRLRHDDTWREAMSIEIIVSYDATEMDQDALALGQVLAGAGNSLALAYVRHAKEEADVHEALAANEAAELLDTGARLLGNMDIPRFIVFSASTPAGLSELAKSEQASLIVFGSEYRTANGHVEPQASARRLLDGGRVAIAVAPAGFRERNGKKKIKKIAPSRPRTTPASRRPPIRSRSSSAPQSRPARTSIPTCW